MLLYFRCYMIDRLDLFLKLYSCRVSYAANPMWPVRRFKFPRGVPSNELLPSNTLGHLEAGYVLLN